MYLAPAAIALAAALSVQVTPVGHNQDPSLHKRAEEPKKEVSNSELNAIFDSQGAPIAFQACVGWIQDILVYG